MRIVVYKRYFTLFIIFFIVLLASCAQKLRPESREDNAMVFKVLSYNIHHANPPSKPGIIDLEAIANVIRTEKPDVVGLQEVDRSTKRSNGLDQAQVLAQKTGMHFKFFKAIDYDGGDYGLAILSKYPIEEAHSVALPQVNLTESRILAYIALTLPNRQKIIFANTHLDHKRPDSNRVVQVQTILKEFSNREMPVAICGDFNSTASQPAIKILDTEFTRSCVSGCGFTIPEKNPNRTIDYIAIKNANWKLLSHKVIPETYASDHRPVSATYQLNK